MKQNHEKYKIKSNAVEFLIDEKQIEVADIIQIRHDQYNFIKNGQSVNLTILAAADKKIKVEIENNIFDIEIKDNLDQQLELMGLDKPKEKKINEIKAPMPGLVLDIFAKKGESIKNGSIILVLEAMKMENAIKIPIDAMIKDIFVQKGEVVEKGQILVELE